MKISVRVGHVRVEVEEPTGNGYPRILVDTAPPDETEGMLRVVDQLLHEAVAAYDATTLVQTVNLNMPTKISAINYGKEADDG